ncbi:hypothetical protein BTN49_1776 [Candidatus Enterovibrio escicola]|uniref:Mobile element protein n=1 Tax=Candidatus Enterovibrio escicola TaxID=1927127 RepID=A0A2A5T302_9GAMM|nr:hypothetical protein BTN49_1776 [Candidatus Enterovibrio escacola]
MYFLCVSQVNLVIGSVNAKVFHAWIEQDLLPKALEQAVIAVDNAIFHKHSDTL